MSKPIDIAALVFAAVFPFAAAWLYLVVLAGQSGALQGTYGAAKMVQFVFPLIWVVLVRRERQRFPITSIRGVGEGLALGVTVLAGLLILYFAWLKPGQYLSSSAAQIAAKAASFGMGSRATFIAGGVLLSSLHALLEEYYWRWFLFAGLKRYLPVAAAIILSALAFTAHHVILLSTFFGDRVAPIAFFSLCVFIGGAAWAWIYHRSGSLLGPWLSHVLIDAGIFVVGYDLIWGS